MHSERHELRARTLTCNGMTLAVSPFAWGNDFFFLLGRVRHLSLSVVLCSSVVIVVFVGGMLLLRLSLRVFVVVRTLK